MDRAREVERTRVRGERRREGRNRKLKGFFFKGSIFFRVINTEDSQM